MRKKVIPVNNMTGDTDSGIAMERHTITSFSKKNNEHPDFSQQAEQSHRHDSHSFFLLERGTVLIEIDFKKHRIKAPALTYVHPDQVHRTMIVENAVVTSWSMTNENIQPQYLELLEDITASKPISLTKETFALFFEATSLCLKFTQRTNDELHHFLMTDSCNALMVLAISQFLAQSGPSKKISRLNTVTRSFRKILERNYATIKRPAAYAEKLNISAPYLNECVSKTTGYPVSYHIQQRIILEAKRMLYHSEKSVKEIATMLGYDDHAYFSRLFTKIAGMSALSFRNKNRD